MTTRPDDVLAAARRIVAALHDHHGPGRPRVVVSGRVDPAVIALVRALLRGDDPAEHTAPDR